MLTATEEMRLFTVHVPLMTTEEDCILQDLAWDALHVGDLNPNRPGLEIWSCFESSGGAALRDARTGEVLFRWHRSSDTGRLVRLI